MYTLMKNTVIETFKFIICFQLANSAVNSINDCTQDHQFLNEGHDKVSKPYDIRVYRYSLVNFYVLCIFTLSS